VRPQAPLLRLALAAAALALAAASARASDAPEPTVLAAVRAADDERVAATLAADRARLGAVLSDSLRYAHSNGAVDTKASFIESVTGGRTSYRSIHYTERVFVPAAPGVLLMHGRALVEVRAGAQDLRLDLGFLAVWRRENGVWRFLAWQSNRIPPPPAAK
jgi:hypothetical protein